jgi:hypothetical protein
MTTFEITYLDERGRSHTDQVEALDVEAAITAIEDQLNQRIEVKQIEILDDLPEGRAQ